MPKKKLLLIDCLNIMYRYHHSFLKSPMFTGSLNTSSIFGLLKQMVTASLQFDIDTVIVCNDKGDSFRKDHYPAYKEGRSPQPEEITIALTHLPQIFESMNVAFVEAEKLEADDIIGTYTKWGLELGFEIYILSGDKDFCQLLERDVYLLKRGKKDGDTFDIWDHARLLEEFGLRVAKDFIEILGLEGDKADNYMGAQGIGVVTACKWMTKYDSIDNLFEHLDDLTPKKQEGLTRDREDVYMAQWLATIFCDGRDRMPCLVELTTDDILEPAKAVPMLAQYQMFSVMDQIGLKYERNV